MAGNTRFAISGDLDADYRGARRLVDTQKPATSVLLSKAAGQNHAGDDEDEAVSAGCSACHSGATGYRFYVEFGTGLEVLETSRSRPIIRS